MTNTAKKTTKKQQPTLLATQIDEFNWSVFNGKDNTYTVATDGKSAIACNCEGFANWGKTCKHMKHIDEAIGCDSSLSQDEKCSSSVDKMYTNVVNVNSNTGIYTAQNSDGTSVVHQLCSNVATSIPSKDSLANPDLQCDSWQVISSVLPDGFVLTNDQQNAAIAILNWLNDRTPKYDVSDRIFLLFGFAGTGKTTLLKTVIKAWLVSGNSGKVAFCAPTAQAVNVMRKTMNGSIPDSAFMTCHKLLELKPVKGNQRQMEFEPDPSKDPKFPLFRLIIIDECSMINDELYSYIIEAVQRNVAKLEEPIKVLFVGDSAQIKPVNSPSLSATFGIQSQCGLSEVMRYGGAIGQFATELRNNLDAPKPIKPSRSVDPETGHGIYVADSEEKWMRSLINAFSSEQAEKNPEFVRAIAYTNARVEKINHVLRNHFYPGAEEFVVGERLLVQEAYAPNDTVILENSSEVVVKRVSAGFDGRWKVWYLDVLRNDGTMATVTTLHRNDKQKFQKALEDLTKIKRWRDFWDLKDAFAHLRYCYALTAHKAQGSTFCNVYIDFNNIVGAASAKSESSRIKERNQLLYTAVTRAAERLVLF